MFTVEVITGDLIEGPICQKCSGITRLVGAERHPVMRELTVLTFEVRPLRGGARDDGRPSIRRTVRAR